MTPIQLSKLETLKEVVHGSCTAYAVSTEIICRAHTTSCVVTSTIHFMSSQQRLPLTLPLQEL
jgi:hypothetical protein